MILSILLTGVCNQPMKAYAYADLHRERGHHDEKPHYKGDDHRRDGDKQDQHHDEHQDAHQDEHHDEHHG